MNLRQRNRAEPRAEPSFIDAEAVLNIEMTTRDFVPFFRVRHIPAILPPANTAPGSPTVLQTADRYPSSTRVSRSRIWVQASRGGRSRLRRSLRSSPPTTVWPRRSGFPAWRRYPHGSKVRNSAGGVEGARSDPRPARGSDESTVERPEASWDRSNHPSRAELRIGDCRIEARASHVQDRCMQCGRR